MKNFGKGFIAGSLTVIGAVAGSVFAFKKAVVDPIEEREALNEERRKRSVRKRNSMRNG